MLGSWEDIVGRPESLDQAVNVVHGALPHYDLPELTELAGAEKVKLRNPVNGMSNPIK